MIVPCNELIGELNYYYAGTIQKNRTMHRNMNACYVHLSYDAMRQSCHAVCKWSHMHRHTQTKLGTQQDLWNASRRFVTLRLLCKQHAVATRLFNESTGVHVGHITRSNIAYFITLHYWQSFTLDNYHFSSFEVLNVFPRFHCHLPVRVNENNWNHKCQKARRYFLILSIFHSNWMELSHDHWTR